MEQKLNETAKATFNHETEDNTVKATFNLETDFNANEISRNTPQLKEGSTTERRV